MERKGERERVREREWENDRMRFFIPYGSATPASSVPPGYHGPLDGHHYAGPSGSGASLLSRSAPLPPTPQQGSSKSRGSPQTVHPTPFPPAYSPRPDSPTPLLTHPWSNRIALVMAVVAVTTPLIRTPITTQDTSADRA